MTEEEIKKQYQEFKRYLVNIIGEEPFDKIIEELGGESAVAHASYATKTDTGLAYEGSLIDMVLTISSYACDINSLLPSDVQAVPRSIYKVCLLSHLAKVIMYKPNSNQWAVEKLGALYEFADLPGALRFGERSTLVAMNAGVTFTPEEFEAMRFIGLQDGDDLKYYASTLSTVIKQGYDLANLVGRKRSHGTQQKQ